MQSDDSHLEIWFHEKKKKTGEESDGIIYSLIIIQSGLSHRKRNFYEQLKNSEIKMEIRMDNNKR